MTNEHMTETERTIREAFPDMSDEHVQKLRLLSVLKQAVENELADGTPPAREGKPKNDANLMGQGSTARN